MDYKEIIKERLGKLPSTLREFVKGEGWRANVTEIGKRFNFIEEKQVALENEVFLVLICLEPVSDFVENLKKGVEIDDNTARTISNYINGAVFSGVMKDIKSMWTLENPVPQEPPKEISKPEIKEAPRERKDNISDSFEQAIINQAKAMQPARVAPPPSNLPTNTAHTTPVTAPPKQIIPPSASQSTPPRSDPYREPVE